MASRVLIIHDWLVTWRGGEKCLEEICELYPDADIFTFFYNPEITNKYLAGRRIISIPFGDSLFVRKYYRHLLLFYPIFAYLLSLKIAKYHAQNKLDLVISISHCWAKNVRLPKDLPHICYCLTPVRYIWDQFDAYLRDAWYKPLAQLPRFFLKFYDINGAKGITKFIAISRFVANRINKYYGREAEVLFPPVERIQSSSNNASREDFFLVVNALVPYKNTQNIVEAFNNLNLPLYIVGTGPESSVLKEKSNFNIKFLENVSREDLESLYLRAKAMIFMAEEDFGITPVEAMSVGLPVIYYAVGGVTETLGAHQFGIGINKTDPTAISNAVLELVSNYDKYLVPNPDISEYVPSSFREKFKKLITELRD